MRDGGQHAALLFAHGCHVQHEARRKVSLRIGNLEELIGAFLEHARCERPEGLAELDRRVELLLHLRSARISDDGARTKSTRPELKAPAEPTAHIALGQGVRHIVEETFVVLDVLVGDLVLVEELLDLCVGVRRA